MYQGEHDPILLEAVEGEDHDAEQDAKGNEKMLLDDVHLNLYKVPSNSCLTLAILPVKLSS